MLSRIVDKQAPPVSISHPKQSPLSAHRAIGTRCETSLHRDLKCAYAGKNGQIEVEVDGYVADGISSQGEFIEVQTSSFGPIRKKIRQFAAKGKVRIIYPVAIAKYIDVYNVDGVRQYRRKSPNKGSPWNIFDVLIYAPDLPFIRRLTIELALLDALELRVQDGKGARRRQGISIHDRQILSFHERICLKKPSDYLRFVPFAKNEEFTSSMLGKKAGIRIRLAQKTLYVLTKMGLVQKTGKKGNALIYQVISMGKSGQGPQQGK